MKIEGLDKIEKSLKKMSDGGKELEQTDEIAITDLLTNDFVSKNTKFDNTQELFDKSGFDIGSTSDFEAIGSEWSDYISSVSSFDSWEEMLESAMSEYIGKKLGF